jgi:hypothetical protein
MVVAKTRNKNVFKCLGVNCMVDSKYATIPCVKNVFAPDGCMVCTLCLKVVGDGLNDGCLLQHLHKVHAIHILGNAYPGYEVVPWIPEMGDGDKSRDGRTTAVTVKLTNFVPAEWIPSDEDLGMKIENRKK